MEEPKFTVEPWEADEYIVTLPGVGPSGCTLSKKDSEVIKKWLMASWSDLAKSFREEKTNLQYSLALKLFAMIRDDTKETPRSYEELLAFFLSAELAALKGQRVLKENKIKDTKSK